MSRRVRLQGADELFRPTDGSEDVAALSAPISDPVRPVSDPEAAQGGDPTTRVRVSDGTPQQPATGIGGETKRRTSSGRTRHEEKITIYVTADELMDLEDTRLAMRRQYGLAVDRGRIVREAIHIALEGVDSEGDQSALVRRLREQ